MNCNDFRIKWMDHVDETALSHIETCDDCLNWIETAFASEEEVTFMKEFPQPSAELEDRIMQTIYAANGQGVLPPLSAAQQSVSVDLKRPKRSWTRLRTGAWVSAAGILLVVGFIGMQAQLGGGGMQQAGSDSTAVAPQSSAPSAAELAPANNTAMTYASQESSMSDEPSQESGVHNSEAEAASLPEETEPQEQRGGTVPEMLGKPLEENLSNMEEALIAMDSANLPQAKHASRPHSETSLTSRDAGAKVPENKNASAENPKNAEKADGTAAKPTDASNADQIEEPLAVQDGTEEKLTATGSEQGEAATDETGELSDDVHQGIVREPVTISTFSDVETAAQVSDIPIPVLVNLPSGFERQSISLRYRSETSNQVSAVSAAYTRDDDQIQVAITRNDSPKRTLSIPGTFVDRRLFPVGSDQAIAVTHDPKNSTARAEHEVHLITTRDNIPLYVTLTASGIRLEELIDLTRTIQWDQE
ncbi:hypothetical protein LOK74_03910 [Brevibacillus humidisoli]|uniref:hypothetical protein n=1 Tax=Brevibacillus humidisoli TaxID=2895522 RepID=UPI001E2B6574|nr:hypothetical protein [Brevibacillus humidisoli]UFJ41670.1 hypothetical protein LOK74_03910 [Brevibacillus humidisoli]